MHPLKTNMRLATAAAAQARGGLLSQEEEEQLRYAEMLIDVSKNRNSPLCHVIEQEDVNVSKLGLPFMQYYTQADHMSAVEWLYPGGHLGKCGHMECYCSGYEFFRGTYSLVKR